MKPFWVVLNIFKHLFSYIESNLVFCISTAYASLFTVFLKPLSMQESLYEKRHLLHVKKEMLKKPTLSRRRMCFIKHFNASEYGNSIEAKYRAVPFLQQFFISLFDYFF